MLSGDKGLAAVAARLRVTIELGVLTDFQKPLLEALLVPEEKR